MINRFIAVLIFGCLLFAFAGMVSASGTSEFLGSTTEKTTGRMGGIVGGHRMCQAEFGPDAVMCNGSEVIFDPSVTAVTEISWVIPTYVAAPDPRLNQNYRKEENTYEIMSGCMQYTLERYLLNRGLILSSSGLSVGACSESYSVACCSSVSNDASVIDVNILNKPLIIKER